MGGDRWGGLILQAQASGLLDYSEFDFQDGASYLREAWLLKELETRNITRVVELQAVRQSAAQAFWDPEGKIYKASAEAALGSIKRVAQMLLPWVKWAEAGGRTIDGSKAEELKTRWEAVFGKMDSPEVRDRIAAFESQVAASEPRDPSRPLPAGVTWVYR